MIEKIDLNADNEVKNRWGNWVFNKDDNTLDFCSSTNYTYYIDLDECTNSAQILDWIAQVSHKLYMTSTDIGNLVKALDDIFNLQRNVCSD